MDLHEGPDRIEFSPLLGRPIRQGSWRELSVSDKERIEQALEARDLDRLTQYWGYLNFGHRLMVGLAYEWALRWQVEAGLEACHSARNALRASLTPVEEPFAPAVLQLLTRHEDPTETAGLAPHLTVAQPTLEAAAGGDWAGAAAAFEQAFTAARAWHDLLFRYTWAIMSAVLAQRGQESLDEAVERVLCATSFYEPSWQQSAGLSQEQLAVMLAEHLRLHFSGGDGRVELIDEPDCIRLVLAPCGSGGAMRAAAAGRPGFSLLAEARPNTWGRAGEVPAYCSHCAVNEHESVRRFGYARWLTQFDPDPHKPCGWTLPKRSMTLP